MSRRDDRLLLQDMLDHAGVAIDATRGRQRAALDNDPIFRAAVERFIEIIGEAASRISPQRQAKFPEIPWADIVAMRNRLVHGYAQVDYDVVWSTIQDDLPKLVALLKRELAE
jgi:uncharacterized protein with HEPN domain